MATTQVEIAPLRTDVVSLHPMLAFASIAALFCATLEISLLEHIDELLLYMTAWEIVLETGAVLVALLVLSLLWWSFGLLLSRILSRIRWTRGHFSSLCWYVWIAIPFSYFTVDAVALFRRRWLPTWNPSSWASLLLGCSFILIGLVGVRFLGVPRIQEFCRARLAPVGWVHVALGVLALVLLMARGVHPYHDFESVGKPLAASNLPDIYLISVDALRAQDMSIYGYARPTTPNLQHFAEQSFVFRNFIANSNFTTPATVSIETGKLPWSHRVFHLGGFLRKDKKQNVAEILRSNGYYTAMVSSNLMASPFCHQTAESYDAVRYAAPLGITGIGLHYTNLQGVNGQATLFYSFFRRLVGLSEFWDTVVFHHRYPYPAEDAFNLARHLAQSHQAQPIFLWTHIFPPHDPYWPPAAYRRKFSNTENLARIRSNRLPSGVTVSELRAQYDEMILYADNEIGDFVGWLQQTGRLDKAIVIITADHGESFEHGWFQHSGPYLSSGLIHIPLLIHLPGQRQGVEITQPAQQVDLLPTILDLVGTPIPSWTDGISLKPLLQGGTMTERYIYSMALEEDRTDAKISRGTLAIMDDEFKYILSLDTGAQDLYRYNQDEVEQNDLLGSESGVGQHMRAQLLKQIGGINLKFPSK